MNPEELLKMLMNAEAPRRGGMNGKVQLHREDADYINLICRALKEIWKLSKLNGASGLSEFQMVVAENFDGTFSLHQRICIDLYTSLNAAQLKDLKESNLPMDKELERLYKHCKANHDYVEAKREMEAEKFLEDIKIDDISEDDEAK